MDNDDNGKGTPETTAPVLRLHVNPGTLPMTEHERIIYMLEELLLLARKGQLDQLATVAIGRNGVVNLRYSSNRNAFNLMGIFHRFQNEIDASVRVAPKEEDGTQ